jgi:hypothetical protein
MHHRRGHSRTAKQGRVDPAGQVGKGHARGSARTMVQVHPHGHGGRGGAANGPGGAGGTRHERPGNHGPTRRTARRAR